MTTDSPKPSALARSPGSFTVLMASSELARGGKDVGFVKVFALKQQRRLSILRHCIREAVAEVELRGMSPSLTVPRESRERRMRLRVGDRGRPHSRQLEKFTDVLLGLLDTRMPFPADPRAPSKIAIGEVMGDGSPSSTSASASASELGRPGAVGGISGLDVGKRVLGIGVCLGDRARDGPPDLSPATTGPHPATAAVS